MNVVLDLSVVPEDFLLERVLARNPESRVELENVVSISGAFAPFLYAETERIRTFGDDLLDDPTVETAHPVYVDGQAVRYRMTWDENVQDTQDVIANLLVSEAVLLEATGTGDGWFLRTWFPTHDRISRFQTNCIEDGLSFEIHRLHTPQSLGTERFGLTDNQYEIITSAIEGGYFEVPRRTTVEDLAAEHGVTSGAVSEGLRRALANLLQTVLPVESRTERDSEPPDMVVDE